ncbi:hypothetical protein WICPIJ_005407 [Wickerhamomyces pijperi]|uniref:Uncharacterized protein n=1 Tax=Wickerhamomyces pijperi TaxID=599730 RepID=A0A9P8Q5S1_WICPI|nr:hypothetical protein WICPIJ_005407 [Wickerhamomyces pijperi]
MHGCLRFFFKIVPVVIMLIALILAGLSQGGSRSKNVAFNSSTYLFKIDLTRVNMDKVFENDDRTIAELGFSQIYSFGLWGYCKGQTSSDTDTTISTEEEIKQWFSKQDYNVTYCSKPKSLFTIDIVDNLLNDIETSVSSSLSITLPPAVVKQKGAISACAHAAFILLLIGVAALGLSMLCSLLALLLPSLSGFALGFGLLAFVALIIGAASTLVTYTKVKNNFNNSYNTYGIMASLGDNKFYGMIWAAVVLTLIACIFNLIAVCLDRFVSKEPTRTEQVHDENPFMGYEEKQFQ